MREVLLVGFTVTGMEVGPPGQQFEFLDLAQTTSTGDLTHLIQPGRRTAICQLVHQRRLHKTTLDLTPDTPPTASGSGRSRRRGPAKFTEKKLAEPGMAGTLDPLDETKPFRFMP